MVIITEAPDGDWVIKFDWAIPEVVKVEDSDIRELRDELIRMFGVDDG